MHPLQLWHDFWADPNGYGLVIVSLLFFLIVPIGVSRALYEKDLDWRKLLLGAGIYCLTIILLFVAWLMKMAKMELSMLSGGTVEVVIVGAYLAWLIWVTAPFLPEPYRTAVLRWFTRWTVAKLGGGEEPVALPVHEMTGPEILVPAPMDVRRPTNLPGSPPKPLNITTGKELLKPEELPPGMR